MLFRSQKPTAEPKLYIQEIGNRKSLIANREEVEGFESSPITTHSPLTPPQPTINLNNFADNAKRSMLDVLRAKYGDKYDIVAVEDPIPLDLETLQPHWNHYASKLKEDSKHSQVNAFNTAKLIVENETFFNITVDSTLQQKFIEQEKTMLLDYLQKRYHNRQISFGFIVVEGEKQAIPLHLQLNGKQRYERIAEQYPLVKELRDRLKLEIDF